MSDEGRARDAGYDDFLDALDSGAGYYLECEEGHGWVPPRTVCPTCGSREFTEPTLPETGEVIATTTIHVAAPQFEEDTPYVVAVVDLGPVTVTGQVQGGPTAEIDTGLVVSPTVLENETQGDRLLGFQPLESG